MYREERLPRSGGIQASFAKLAEFQKYQQGDWVVSYLQLKTNRLKAGGRVRGRGALTAGRKERPDARTGKSPIAGGGGRN